MDNIRLNAVSAVSVSAGKLCCSANCNMCSKGSSLGRLRPLGLVGGLVDTTHELAAAAGLAVADVSLSVAGVSLSVEGVASSLAGVSSLPTSTRTCLKTHFQDMLEDILSGHVKTYFQDISQDILPGHASRHSSSVPWVFVGQVIHLLLSARVALQFFQISSALVGELPR